MMQAIKETVINRFWNMVAKPSANACWPWLGGTHARGYGRTRWGGQPEQAHRVAWIITNGEIAPGYEIAQACGNKLCCNPAHLVIRPDKQQSQAYLHRQIERITARIHKLEDERTRLEALLN